MPPPLVPEVKVEIAGREDQAILREVVRQVYDLEGDDRRFRESAVADEKLRMKNFDLLRSNYPERREFQYTRVTIHGASEKLCRALTAFGFIIKAIDNERDHHIHRR